MHQSLVLENTNPLLILWKREWKKKSRPTKPANLIYLRFLLLNEQMSEKLQKISFQYKCKWTRSPVHLIVQHPRMMCQDSRSEWTGERAFDHQQEAFVRRRKALQTDVPGSSPCTFVMKIYRISWQCWKLLVRSWPPRTWVRWHRSLSGCSSPDARGWTTAASAPSCPPLDVSAAVHSPLPARTWALISVGAAWLQYFSWGRGVWSVFGRQRQCDLEVPPLSAARHKNKSLTINRNQDACQLYCSSSQASWPTKRSTESPKNALTFGWLLLGTSSIPVHRLRKILQEKSVIKRIGRDLDIEVSVADGLGTGRGAWIMKATRLR